jgi:hypothetical protein
VHEELKKKKKKDREYRLVEILMDADAAVNYPTDFLNSPETSDTY